MNRRSFLKSSILGGILIPSALKGISPEKINYNIYYELGKRDEYANYVLWSTESKEDEFKKYYNIDFVSKICDTDRKEIGEIHFGKLNEKLFDTIDKKIYYLKGVFDSYSGETLKDGYLKFIRSEDKFNRCSRWLIDVYDGFKISSRIIGCMPVYVTRHYHVNKISINKNLIDYIKNYE